jgi:hypothetical protein
MILGFVSLLLIFFTNDKNKAKMDLNIQEITYINELTLTIDLIMLTIGNSWRSVGRELGALLGWDPKETWALIVLWSTHLCNSCCFVPALRGNGSLI